MTDISNRWTLPRKWREYSTDKLAIRGARLLDPAIKLDRIVDLLIVDGRIKAIGELPNNWDGVSVDGTGWMIIPGLFDMHVHLREPGFEYKETVRSGCCAAAAGGFTGVAPMPNTEPPIDSPGLMRFLRDKALGCPVEVHPIPAVSRSRKGEQLSEITELCEAGATAFTDDGSPVENAELMRRALEYSLMSGSVIIEHCEDRELSLNGVMHEGEVSLRLGFPGWPKVAEEIAVDRNIRLAEYTGARLHVAHISTADSVDLVRQAKSRGVKVTTEATPQHLTLNCDLLESFNTDYKVNPPLRTQDDVDALVAGLADGTIDAIASDHAPHSPDEKEVEFIHAPFGMTGLETALGVVYTSLVKTDKISMERLIDAMSAAPRRILNLPQPSITIGEPANLTLFNPTETWTIDRDLMESKSKNTPFNGWDLIGRPKGVINDGIAWISER